METYFFELVFEHYRPATTSASSPRHTGDMRLLLRLLVAATAFWIVAAVVPGVHVRAGAANYLLIAVIFGVVNALVGPVLRLLTLPLTLATLGLFRILVNAALLGITAALTSRLSLDGFVPTVVASLLIGAVTWAADQALRRTRARR